jgi:exodeoxyribonuclease VII small subunit
MPTQKPLATKSKNEPAVSEPNPDIAALPFETALKELEGIVEKLEKGSVSLEESIAIYERGEALKKHCETLLKSAEQRIEKITLGADGTPTGSKPLDIE